MSSRRARASSAGAWQMLYNACRLMILNLRACTVYAAPAMLALGALIYFLLSEAAERLDIIISALAFMIANTLFVYAASEQMLKKNSRHINIAGAFKWRRHHNDFFIFVALGMMVVAVVSVHVIDAVGYLTGTADRLTQEKLALKSRQQGGVLEGSYVVLIFGSKAAAVVLLLGALLLWSYFCRSGMRIPAHVEGYYLRGEEAMSLTQHKKVSVIAVSLLFIVGVSAFAELAARDAESRWQIAAVWALGYFFMAVSHIGLWVYLYTALAKDSGYRITRLG